jgi:hypothetical protein
MDPPEERQEPAAAVNFEEATEEGEGHSRGASPGERKRGSGDEPPARRAGEELVARGGENEARRRERSERVGRGKS